MIGTNQLFRYLSASIALAIMWALGGNACSADALATTEAPTSVKVPTYPVKTSANNRYLVDRLLRGWDQMTSSDAQTTVGIAREFC